MGIGGVSFGHDFPKAAYMPRKSALLDEL